MMLPRFIKHESHDIKTPLQSKEIVKYKLMQDATSAIEKYTHFTDLAKAFIVILIEQIGITDAVFYTNSITENMLSPILLPEAPIKNAIGERENIFPDINYTLNIEGCLLSDSYNNQRINESTNFVDFFPQAVDSRTLLAIHKQAKFKYFVSVPVIFNKKSIGAILLCLKGASIEKATLELVKYTLTFFSVAFNNAMLIDLTQRQIIELENKNYDLSVLFNLASKISKTLDPDEVSKASVECISSLKNIIGALIYAVDPQHKYLTLKALSENKFTEKLVNLAIEEKRDFKNIIKIASENEGLSPIVSTYINDKVHVVEDIEVLFSTDISEKIRKEFSDIKSIIFYPLNMGEETIGVIAYMLDFNINEREEENFKLFLVTITTQISIALENATSFAESQKVQDELSSTLDNLKEIRRKEQDMIDIMGHELRTPMSILRNALSAMDLQIKKKGEIPVDKQKQYLDIALDSARREATLIETILSATKRDSVGFEMLFEKVNIGELINVSIEHITKEVQKKGLEILYKKDDDDIFVYCDKGRLQEILDNFTSNAVKYTETGFIEIKLETDKDFTYVTIKDSGVGIDKIDLENLGKKFYRAKQYGKADTPNNTIIRPGGTGLGLYVTFALIKLMDGDYRIDSEINKGSIFSFWIPLYKGQEIKRELRKFQEGQDNKASTI